GQVTLRPSDELPAHLRDSRPDVWDHHLVADTTRIRRELGYREVVSREEGLRRALDWYAAEPPEDPKRAGNLDYEAEDAALVTIRDRAGLAACGGRAHRAELDPLAVSARDARERARPRDRCRGGPGVERGARRSACRGTVRAGADRRAQRDAPRASLQRPFVRRDRGGHGSPQDEHRDVPRTSRGRIPQ